MTSYLERYQAGEHEAVWAELLALGAKVREEPLAADARAVAEETMRRVRLNVETIVERLRGIGYEFAYPDQVLVGPEPEVLRAIDALERQVGPLPLALRVFYEKVGSVCLMGSHPTLSAYAESPNLGSFMASVKNAFTQHLGAPPPASPPPALLHNPLFARLSPEAQAEMGSSMSLIQALMGSVREVQEETARSIEQGTPPSPRLMQLHGLAEGLAASMPGMMVGPGSEPRVPAGDGPPASDPLVVWPPQSDDPDDYRAWDEDEDDEDDAALGGVEYVIEIAPDATHKANESGGGPYEVAFPDPAVDGPFRGDEDYGTFVEYLRECFRWGGFPGLRDQVTPPAELDVLRRDLLPI